MKKIILSALSLIALLSLSCSSGNELKECKGKLWAITDSALIVSVDGDSVCFESSDLQVAGNDVIIPGDSLSIQYIGRLSGRCKALVVSPIIKSRVVDGKFDPTKELITAPAEEE